ncbi:HET-domain-containing protein [Dothidotthia symphoricarpi CBS 119687]|uniref:HET-domain-containing protein n=1 Tax=Dothidotthia symphoricarpi CBS 119687 TaxID=1392245 RepID=A0A6A6AEM6_9PLEO|nr:HET-domain-containing protein [Dothidotthia symphoricarpi CBS 119687]KAF2130270.1 HET-domain-containing protein [Dothidotthia symphoricarpi CBS 119687]
MLDQDSLCETCSSLSYEQMRTTEGQAYHTSWAALEESASLGCRLCKYFWAGSTVSVFDKTQSARLHIEKHPDDDFGVWLCLRVDNRLLKIFEVFSKPGPPTGLLGREIIGRELALDRSSDSAISKIQSWIHECESSHSQCRGRSISPLPTRVLDVSPSQDPDQVRLIEGRGLKAEYVTLSHCWGKTPPDSEDLIFTCTSRNIQTLTQSFPLSVLPTLYKDAVMMTRLLRIRYIWIDSLCIIQDSKEDWANECLQMCDVYSNTYLTISAVSCKNSLRGFVRVDQECLPLQVQLCQGYGDSKQALHIRDTFVDPAMYLTGRGWVFQELLLSPRVLHFSSIDMVFQCDTHTVFESTSVTCYGWNNHDGKRLVYGTTQHSRSTDYDKWLKIVQDYSEKKLTYETDMFPALSGIAHIVQSRTNDEYVAGLWKGDLVAGLLWSKNQWLYGPVQLSTQYLTPTWSWASSNHVDTFNTRRRKYLKLDILHAEAVPSTTNPFGEISSASLIVSGPLKRTMICDLREIPDDCVQLTSVGGSKIRFAFDIGQHKVPDLDEVWCLDCTVNKEDDIPENIHHGLTWFNAHGLVLEQVSEKKQVYKRIGVFEVFGVDVGTGGDTDWHRTGWSKTRLEII